ncbi:hypothetical protein [Streptomyces sp. NBC_00233]|uniref:hypothetical protein n=1 Tax=Streptomyces sp. NBC_00233 TaxID=2975686 RepID=UPI00224D3446|nr:hypothetical protein [Streptomyces sp. NBC_00233]MCX5233204.1 hypothetical protein [Streptomyces sp. NBC_00233]
MIDQPVKAGLGPGAGVADEGGDDLPAAAMLVLGPGGGPVAVAGFRAGPPSVT